MSSTRGISARMGNIDTLDVNTLNINQSTTSVKWDPSKKHPDIQLLNGTNTAKLASGKSGSKAIMANIAYTIGTSIDTISFKIHQGSTIRVGLAESSRTLSSVDPGTDLISHAFNVVKDTVVKMTLSWTLVSSGVYSSSVTFEYEGTVIVVDSTGYNSQVMYPWFSDDSGTGFSVSVSRVSVLKVYVRDDGGVVFSTVSDGDVSRPIIFETGSDQTVFDNVGFSSIPSITYDVVETSTAMANGAGVFDMTLRVAHPSAPGISNPGVTIGQDAKFTTPLGISAPYLESPSTLILRQSGGADVTIDAAGDLVLPGTVTASSVISATMQGVPNTHVSVLESSGKGIVIQDVTGEVYISDRLSVGDSGHLTSPAVLANFNTTAQNSAIVVPVLPDVTTNTIPGANLVLGMVCYSVADAKFMGFAAAGWVGLSI